MDATTPVVVDTAAAAQLNVPLVTHNAADYRAVDDLVLLTAPSQ